MAQPLIDTRSGILKALGAACRDDVRRELLITNFTPLQLNGIDFVEYVKIAGANVLRVHFLFPLPAGPDPYQLASANFPTIRIEGGERIVGITPQTPSPDGVDNTVLHIPVSAQGDFSTYWLSIGWSPVEIDNSWSYNLPGVDRQFSVAPINFRPGCPVDFDCAPMSPVPPPPVSPPAIDYLAKDYSSFRQLLLDTVTQRNPTWLETNPSDLGIMLLEILAYEGDYLSYFQDVVANEAFLDTVRKRISAKRHARLVDYHMHDGRNAWTYVHLQIAQTSTATAGTLGPGLQLLTRIDVPLRHQLAPPPVTIDPDLIDYDTDPALADVKVFETSASVRFNLLHNELRLHTWGNHQCTLPAGTTVCHLFAIQGGNTAVLPDLMPGDWLLLEEVIGPFTGAAADANPKHRQVVRIKRADKVTDQLFSTALDMFGQPIVRIPPANPLQVLEVAWDSSDALTFCLCLSTMLSNGKVVGALSVGRGNIIPADHGRFAIDTVHLDSPVGDNEKYLLTLTRSPLTMQAQPATQLGIFGERTDLAQDVRSVIPAVQLWVTDNTGAPPQQWLPKPDLLESDEFSTSFVVDVDDDGQGILRFGDDSYGRSISGASEIVANYRVGNGTAGNVGADALAHIVAEPDPSTIAPAAVAGGAGGPNGTYTFVITFVTPTFESTPSPASAALAVAHQNINLSNIISSADPRVTGRNIYGFKNGVSAAYQLIGKLNDNTTSTFIVASDQPSWTTQLGSLAPPASTPTLAAGAAGVLTGTYTIVVTFATAASESTPGPGSAPIQVTNQSINLTNIPTSVNPAVTTRNIYGFKNGSSTFYQLIGTLNDNVTTAFAVMIDQPAWGKALPAVFPSPGTPLFSLVRNPLPAQGGVDPEAIEQVRQYAPSAFHAVQYRAVTEADYIAAALTLDGISDAVAEFRWTGSWYTVFLGINPSDPTNVITESGGRTFLDPAFASDITAQLSTFKLAGYDLEVRSAEYVSLDVELQLCVASDHFRADVVAAVLQALGNGVEPDGSLGFFNPANFRFGQSVYLSQVYAAIDKVEGVDSATVTVFQRYGQQPQGELQNGVIPMQPWEIARLDNDVNLKENGLLLITADGGK